MINPAFILIGVVVLYVLFTSWRIRRRAAATSKSDEIVSGPYSDEERRRYIAETVPALLESYKALLPSFYSRFAAEYLRTGRQCKILREDIVDGVNPHYALWCVSHCVYLASMRFYAINQIENAESVEASFIKFRVDRPHPNCPRVPQNKKYKVTDTIPVFPCADCEEERPCLFSYDYEY